MASLKDAQKVTRDLRRRAEALHAEVASGEIDFAKVVGLADELGAAADRVATTFQAIDEAFGQQLGGEGGEAGGDSGREDGQEPTRSQQKSDGDRSGSSDGPSRQELYRRARKAGIPGRSDMSKDELAKALRKTERSRS